MLKATAVSKAYRGASRKVKALEGTALCLEADERLGLVGPSGCGKSTLARTLALLERPDSGTVELDEETIRRFGLRCPASLRRRVQLLWQSPREAMDPRLSLRQAILEPAVAANLLTAEKKKKVLGSWAERVGLTDELMGRYPHEVSEGQLQRACLARALILEPRYLICDEPTSMLDVSTQAALLDAIDSEQQRSGLGVLLITHDAILARHWCRKVLDWHTDVSHPSAGSYSDPSATEPSASKLHSG